MHYNTPSAGMTGALIFFEGVDGCGKSKQFNLLLEVYKQQGIAYERWREPGGSLSAEKIRTILLDKENTDITPQCETLLYTASRAITNLQLKPLLEKGQVVVQDRSYWSTLAYQHARGVPIEDILWLSSFADCITPLRGYLFRIPYTVVEERLRQSGKSLDRLESDPVFTRKVIDAYDALPALFPESAMVIDGTQDIPTIHQLILEDQRRLKILR
ncbi:MAG: dTMP kinase [archaeon]